MTEPPERSVDEDRLVDRLFALVVEELRRRGHPFDEPLTVAELCDDVAPYGAVRAALALDLKADYDHALLLLLAGSGDHVQVEPDEVRQELQHALASPNPDVDAYRAYGAARVRVDPASVAPEPEPAAHEPAPTGPAPPDAPAPGPTAPDEPPPTAPDEPPPTAPDAPAIRLHREVAGAGEGGAELPHPGPLVPVEGLPCSFCSRPLPPGRRVRFCPFCGGDQRLRPCPGCDAALEREWRYCVRCGRGVDDDDE